MFENIANFFRKLMKSEKKEPKSKESAKERLHLVLMQDRANVSADFLDLMKQEIIEVIKKYIDVDENAIDVRLTNKTNDDGTNGAPALYANIPIVSIKDDAKKKVETEKKEEQKENNNDQKEENKKQEDLKEESKQEDKSEKLEEKQENEQNKEETKPEETKEDVKEEVEEKLEQKVDAV